LVQGMPAEAVVRRAIVVARHWSRRFRGEDWGEGECGETR
jgi:hypothetical protein